MTCQNILFRIIFLLVLLVCPVLHILSRSSLLFLSAQCSPDTSIARSGDGNKQALLNFPPLSPLSPLLQIRSFLIFIITILKEWLNSRN